MLKEKIAVIAKEQIIMPEEINNQEQTGGRTEIKDLAQPEQELSAEEQKDVKGGLTSPTTSRTIGPPDIKPAAPQDIGTAQPPDQRTL